MASLQILSCFREQIPIRKHFKRTESYFIVVIITLAPKPEQEVARDKKIHRLIALIAIGKKSSAKKCLI